MDNEEAAVIKRLDDLFSCLIAEKEGVKPEDITLSYIMKRREEMYGKFYEKLNPFPLFD